MGKKEVIINGDNDVQNALDDALNYQTIEKHPQRVSKLKAYINKYNWKGIKCPSRPEEWKKKLNEIIRQLYLMYYIYHTIQKQQVLHIDQNITTSVESK